MPTPDELAEYLKKVHDEDTGASYYSVKDDLFKVIPYNTLHKIGSGLSGEVLLMESKNPSHMLLAAKVFSLKDKKEADDKMKTFLTEVGILQELKHDHIVTCFCPIACPSSATILMEYLSDGPLHDHLDSLTDDDVPKFFIQILSALRHMHSKRIVHRDIKLDNILIRNKSAYLTDFGLSVRLPEDSSSVKGRVGTPAFMAPEVKEASMLIEYNGFKADSYSMAVVLWSTMMKEEPKVYVVLSSTLIGKKLNPTLCNCIRRLSRKDPETRWDITRLLEDLRKRGYRSWQIDLLS